MRERFYIWITQQLYFPFCYWVYKGKHSSFNTSDLESLPTQSLGQALLRFIRSENLELILGYELHDIKHVLLGYHINFGGEISMQYFELGNRNRSLPVLVVVFFGTLLKPELFRNYIHAYKRGKKARSIKSKELEKCLGHNLIDLRKELCL